MEQVKVLDSISFRSAQSKESGPIPRDTISLMDILNYCLNPKDDNMSLLGSVSIRQQTVISAFEFNKEFIEKNIKILQLITDDESEIKWASKKEYPIVFVVDANPMGAESLVNYNNQKKEEYKKLYEFVSGEIPKKYVDGYMQSLERCTFNTFLVLLLINQITTSGGIVKINKKGVGLGTVISWGWVKCYANINTNPLQIPYNKSIVSECIFAGDETQNVGSGPGYLYDGKLPYNIIYVDIQFVDRSRPLRYYIDPTYPQVNIKSEKRFLITCDEDTIRKNYNIVDYIPFDLQDSLHTLVSQIGLLYTKLSQESAKRAWRQLMVITESIDKRFHTDIKEKIDGKAKVSEWAHLLFTDVVASPNVRRVNIELID
tara:strand:- start:4334 stop:5452 length:1119 start_codon:yes stop_codon:yes gene_type:complete